MRKETDPASYDPSSGIFFDGLNRPILPKKQNLSAEELSKQNIRGYAALVQEIFRPPHEIFERQARRNLLRGGTELDPITTIDINASKTRDLVEGVELALCGVPSRSQQAIRLYFSLDQVDGKPMTQKNIGGQIKDHKGQRFISGQSVHTLITKGLRVLRHPRFSKKLKASLWGDKEIPYLKS